MAINETNHGLSFSEVGGVISDMGEDFKKDFANPIIGTYGLGVAAFVGRLAFPGAFEHITQAEVNGALVPILESSAALIGAGMILRMNSRRVLNHFRHNDQPFIDSAINPVSVTTSNFADPSLFETGIESVM